MAYFSDTNMREKLSIIYFLDRFGGEATAVQVHTSLSESVGLNYFECRLALSELEETGNVCSVPLAYGNAYKLTDEGRQALAMFIAQLPLSLRETVDDYINTNSARIAALEQYSARRIREPAGGYNACLSVYDKDALLLNISIRVPDAPTAKKLCDSWEERANEVYGAIIDKLTRP